jgi:hypothetical protein
VGCRDREDRLVEIGDLIVVVYPHVEWDWQRYKIGDIGIVLNISHYETYTVVRARLFRTDKTEAIPANYVLKLGEESGCGRSDSVE